MAKTPKFQAPKIDKNKLICNNCDKPLKFVTRIENILVFECKDCYYATKVVFNDTDHS